MYTNVHTPKRVQTHGKHVPVYVLTYYSNLENHKLCVCVELSGLTLTLVMVGKTGVTGAYAFLFLYTSELFPTVVRNMAVGATSMASHLGSTVSPYIAFMGQCVCVSP